MDDDELIRRLRTASDMEPSAERTHSALDRARLTLTNDRPSPRPRRFSMLARCSALAAAIAIASSAIWLLTPFGGGNRAFAFETVQDKVKQTKSITMTVVDSADPTKESDRIRILADGRVRIDEASGNYTVVDPKAEVHLTVDVKRKTAILFRGMKNRSPMELYRIIREIKKDEVRKLPAQKIDGKEAEVFVARLKTAGADEEITVWVDVATQLPVRISQALPAEHDQPKKTLRYDLKFDQPIEESLFSIVPPEGYVATERGFAGKLQPAKEESLQAPTVTLGSGIGPVAFGMGAKEIVEKLGEPDKVDGKGTALDYLSRGFSIHVSPKRGALIIICYTQATFAIEVQDFAGKTKEGIAMGATSEAIVKAYGPPDETKVDGATKHLSYRTKLGAEFMLSEDKLVQYSLTGIAKK